MQIIDGVTDAIKVVQAIVELTGKPLKFNDLKLFLASSKSSSVVGLSHLKELIRHCVLCEQIERTIPGEGAL